MKTTGYVVADGIAIYASGRTKASAVRHFFEDCQPDESAEVLDGWDQCGRTHVAPATPELLKLVRKSGGCVAWRYIHGAACTMREYENFLRS